MNKEERLVYIALTEEMKGSLCTFCKYGDWYADGCCEGHNECQHPIEALSSENRNAEELEPGDDCYGFRPNISVSLATDLVGAIISQGFDEWFYRRFSRKSVTVYGRSYDRGVETTGKVRIG